MRLAALISGGKDSLYSMFLGQKKGHGIDYIISFTSENPESYMFHIPNVHLVEEIANNMSVPIIKKETKGIKEEELQDIRDVLQNLKGKIDGIVTGATASNYQKQRIDNICNELGLASLAPIWQKNPEATLRSMLMDGFEIIIVGVAAPPLDEKWLGRPVDEECVQDLVKLNKQLGLHILGEGGEYESLVLDCPLYKKRMVIQQSEINWDPKTRSGHYTIKKIIWEEKS